MSNKSWIKENWLLAIGVIIVMGVFLYPIYLTLKINNLLESNEDLACEKSQEFVSGYLKAPSTASFSTCNIKLLKGMSINGTYEKIGWTYEINGYVDSQNSFGAMIRSEYSVRLLHFPTTSKWFVDELKIDDATFVSSLN